MMRKEMLEVGYARSFFIFIWNLWKYCMYGQVEFNWRQGSEMTQGSENKANNSINNSLGRETQTPRLTRAGNGNGNAGVQETSRTNTSIPTLSKDSTLQSGPAFNKVEKPCQMTVCLVRNQVVLAVVSRFGEPGLSLAPAQDAFFARSLYSPPIAGGPATRQTLRGGVGGLLSLPAPPWVEIVEKARPGDVFEFWCVVPPGSCLQLADFVVTVSTIADPRKPPYIHHPGKTQNNINRLSKTPTMPTQSTKPSESAGPTNDIDIPIAANSSSRSGSHKNSGNGKMFTNHNLIPTTTTGSTGGTEGTADRTSDFVARPPGSERESSSQFDV